MEIACGLSLLCFCLFSAFRRDLIAWWVASDIQGWARAVRSWPCPLEVKLEILERFETIERRLGEEPIGWWQWLRHSDTIGQLLSGEVTGEKLVMLKRELGRVVE